MDAQHSTDAITSYPVKSKSRAQVIEAYKAMATQAGYRPAAPSDGFGNIPFPQEELDLDAEAVDYADRWGNEEDSGDFHVGSANFATRPAMMYSVEAARLLASGADGNEHAERLLRLALEELEQLRNG